MQQTIPKPCFLRLFRKHPGRIRPARRFDPASSPFSGGDTDDWLFALSPMGAAMPTQQDDQQLPKWIFPPRPFPPCSGRAP
jgi:hypothetical protein